ncbi:hypothetical protein GCM10023321_62680 [Pseudonocardia eucalypti]|uniref:Uncharacterized protein n=1 Tax=Pseudonocardia eucalypti TaxID=648755 RepID=A0ABP9QWK8_9PSEU|nr:hypothetical protein [Pseudonocardia eucalypti]
MSLSTRPELRASSIAGIGFFSLLGVVSSIVQVTQSVADGEFSVLAISVTAFAVVVVGAVCLRWIRTRRRVVGEVGRIEGPQDKTAVLVVVCLLLMTLSLLAVAASSVAVAVLTSSRSEAPVRQATVDPSSAATEQTAERPKNLGSRQPGPAGEKSAISFGSGTYVVGVDIQPGVYRTAGPSDERIPMCSWTRLRDTSGDFSAVLAIDNTEGPTTVTIKATDGAFKSSSCQDWVKVD